MALTQRTANPWWLSPLVLLGLLVAFVGARGLVGDLSGPACWLGAALVGAVTVVRAVGTVRARGGRRRVERTLLLTHGAALLALVAYGLSTARGAALLGVTGARFGTAMLVATALLALLAIVPLVVIEATLGTARRRGFDLAPAGADEADVEYLRVRELGWSGLTVALALALAVTTCGVARAKNVRRDVSYFRTSSPGASTINIVRSTAAPIDVLLFFPDGNEVGTEVRAYFDELAAAAGGDKLTIASHDRAIDAKLALDNGVTKDGTVVVRRGDKKERLELDTNIEVARRGKSKLRTLDREVNSRLLKVVRDKRKAYLTVGHGELTDPDSIGPALADKTPPRKTTAFAARMTALNYETRELGMMDLVGRGVPDDATLVMMLGPLHAPSEPELAALDAYLARGGKLLIALDPLGEATLGPALEARLGVHFDAGHLTDDRNFFPARRNLGDRRWVLTSGFSTHAATTTLSRAADRSGILLIDSGTLEERPLADAATKRTFVITSMPTAWIDRDDDLGFDGDGPAPEARARYNVAAAIEGGGAAAPDGKAAGFRAMVLADADLLADLRIAQGADITVDMVAGPLLDDAVKWLGGEEVFAGEVVSEEDVPIKHSQDKDKTLMLATILGVPMLVLGVGLVFTRRRRPRKAVAS